MLSVTDVIESSESSPSAPDFDISWEELVICKVHRLCVERKTSPKKSWRHRYSALFSDYLLEPL